MPNITEIAPLSLLVWSAPAQNCVSFTNPCTNPFVPTFRHLWIHPKVLERLHLLQCIFAHVHNTRSWASWETQYLKFLVLILIPAWSHAAENRSKQMRAEDPVEKIHACSTNSPAKKALFILKFPTVTPSSTRWRLAIRFI